MTTSLNQSLRSLPDLKAEKIPEKELGYLRSRLRNEVHQSILREFLRLSEDGKMSKAIMAKRLGKDPAQINRLLGSAGNWTMETYADLLSALGMVSKISTEEIGKSVEKNSCHPEYERSHYAIYFCNDTPSKVTSVRDNKVVLNSGPNSSITLSLQ